MVRPCAPLGQSPGAKLAGAGALLSADRLEWARRPTGACGHFVSNRFSGSYYECRLVLVSGDVIRGSSPRGRQTARALADTNGLESRRALVQSIHHNLLTITGFSFIIFILKSPHSNKQINLLFINKTSALIINNIVMLIACITILLGTIYPIIIEVLTNKRMSVGAPYYNSTVLPILLPGFLIMSIAPMLSWQSNKLDKIKNYIYILIVVGLLLRPSWLRDTLRLL